MLGDSVTTNIMTKGFYLSFLFFPPLQEFPPPEVITSQRVVLKVTPIAEDWLLRGIIREDFVPLPRFFSMIFFVLKKNGQVRPILDLSALNKMLRVPSFKMETIEKIVKSVCGSLWGSSIDLTDAYLHVPIAWEFHRYFAFVLGNRTFVFQYLPFGLSPAPWAFSRVMKPIKAFLHRKVMLVFSFLDGFSIWPTLLSSFAFTP